jgi:DNA-binding CsgD family transcriptional regulator
MRAAEASGHDGVRAAALYMRSRALLLAGRTADALVELGRAAEAAERAGDPVTLSIALLDRADALAPAGRLGEVVAEARAVAARLRAAGLTDPHALLADGVAAAALTRQGRHAEARAAAEAVAATGRTAVTLALGHLLVGLADLDDRALGDAREHLEMARFLAAPLLDGRIAGNLGLGRAELALAEGRVEDARSAVDEGIAQVERTGDDEVLALLCLTGLRVVSDRARGADGRSTQRAKAREAAAIERYAARLGTLVTAPTGIAAPTVRAIGAAWGAERLRLDGAACPDAWADVARLWRGVEQPRLAALATIRRAEAALRDPDRRADAPAALAEALDGAHAIGSRLLAHAAREVARRAGIPLPTAAGPGPGPTTAAPGITGDGAGAPWPLGASGGPGAAADEASGGPGPAGAAGTSDPWGAGAPDHGGHGAGTAAGAATAGGGHGPDPVAPLTRREREVLELVAAGATNRQIGAMLYISTKTASVHVSRILAKLGAASRGEAAAVARQAGVVRG